MGYGVDRGGGRESKGGSLRRSKKNPGAAAARAAQHSKHTVELSPVSLPAPRLSNLGIDCSVALLSRKLDATRESLKRTALEYGCGAIVAWCSEIDKQKSLLEACTGTNDPVKTTAGGGTSVGSTYAYCVLGIHPDNVDRTNKKAHEGWLAEVEQLAKAPICVALLTGLNLNREISTHFAQEALLAEVCKLATTKLMLPVIIHTPKGDSASMQRALELALPLMQDPKKIIIADVLACRNPDTVDAVANAGVWATISGTWLATNDDEATGPEAEAVNPVAAKCVAEFPRDQILLATNSPWSTPQTLAEAHMRQLPNEPCNFKEVALAIAQVKGGDVETLLKENNKNAKAAFAFGAEPVKLQKQEEEALDEGGAGEPNSDEGEDGSDSDDKNEEDKEESEEDESEKPVPRKAAKESVKFSCVKCRTMLFLETHLVTHPEGAEKAVFSKGSKSSRDVSCESAFFLDGSSCNGRLMVTPEGTVECKNCQGKLGNLGKSVACPCGCIVPGESLRIIASRVDRLEELSEEELLKKAAQELKDIQDAPSEDEAKEKTKKKAKTNVKASNTANMGNYRNKTFAAVKPVLSDEPVSNDLEAQLAKLKNENDSDDGGGKKRNKKGKRKNNKYDD